MFLPSVVSLLSQLYHLVAYRVKASKMQSEGGMFITSIDIDVGSRELGVINKGENDRNVRSRARASEYHIGEIDEAALPLLVDLFRRLEIPATFAVRGQLTEVNDSVLDLLLESPVKHDVGAHGYYHRKFPELSQEAAENELNLVSKGMSKFGLAPRSFVFPANRVAHLDLLEKYGYKCYRSYGNFLKNCMHIEKEGGLYDIHPSLYLGESPGSIFLKKIVDVAVAERAPFHIWFHSWNLGETHRTIQKHIKNVLFPLYNYAKGKEKTGDLTIETMLSAAETVEKLGLQ